jgi:hypothetical protein
MKAIDAKVDEVLRTAIQQRRLVRLVYQNRQRIVEPHDYGVQNGSPKLLAYQIAGESSGKLPGWRWIQADLISDITLLDQTFPGGRAITSGKHHKWEAIALRVQSSQHSKTSEASAKLSAEIAALGYPGFLHLRGRPSPQPAAVLLAALEAEDLESRVIETLPWVAVNYSEIDWYRLIEQAQERKVQNRLGFVLTLARRLAERQGLDKVSSKLRKVEDAIKPTRLMEEDTLSQAHLSDAERNWIRKSRGEDARYWNLLTDLDSERLPYAS